MKLLDRYNTAVHADNLKSEASTFWSNSDVLGAAGLAAKQEPLGIALARMLAGGGQGQVVAILAEEAKSLSYRRGVKLPIPQAESIAKAVLSWYRHGTCQPCGGTGFTKIKDAPSLGDECQHCSGTGRIPFDTQFQHEYRGIARWLHDEIGRTQAVAGQLAMKKIGLTLDL